MPPKVLKDAKALEDYVHKHVFPKVSQSHREYLAQFFTVIFADGYESGDFSAWTQTLSGGGGSTPVIDSNTVHHGSYSAKLQINTGASAYSLTRKTFASSYSELYARDYVYIDALPDCAGAGGLDYIGVGSSSGTLVTGGIYKDAAGNYYWSTYGQLPGWAWRSGQQETPSVPAWYCLELYVKVHESAGVVKLWVDGTLKVDLSNLDSDAVGNLTRADARLESPGGVSQGSGKIVYVDCVVVADTYIGPEATSQTVTDSLSLSEAALCNKTLSLSDSLGLNDAFYGDKTLLLSDSTSLSELVTVIIGEVMKYVTDAVSIADFALTPSRVLRTLEAIGAADNVVVNKVLQITETVSLAEIIEVGVGGVKKTKLFLILGDLALQLTGD